MSPDPGAPPAADVGWVSARRTPLAEVLLRLVTLPALLAEHRDLITTSVRRDLEARFRGTVLGWVWPLIHPLFLFVVYYFIFTKLLSFKIPNLPEGQEAALGVYMFTGILSWAALSETLTRATSVILDNGNLIKKLAFPSELLPLNVTLVSTVTFGFGLLVFIGACLLTPIWAAPGPELAWVPVILLLQTLFIYGLALFFSNMQVFLRDTQQVIGIAMTVWMFLTPLFWVPEMFGESLDAYRFVIFANPVYHLVMAWRGALMGDLGVPQGDTEVSIIAASDIGGHLAVFAVWALASYVIGYSVFYVSKRRFADEV